MGGSSMKNIEESISRPSLLHDQGRQRRNKCSKTPTGRTNPAVSEGQSTVAQIKSRLHAQVQIETSEAEGNEEPEETPGPSTATAG
mmetsp:Transcript_29508/g.66801  ORF Transcript_29508/g.66801 Transcript_29508/m.66801 type:complete len:86 (-) Transcript_29508:125-382(-)